jgi:hypothetical protein
MEKEDRDIDRLRLKLFSTLEPLVIQETQSSHPCSSVQRQPWQLVKKIDDHALRNPLACIAAYDGPAIVVLERARLAVEQSNAAAFHAISTACFFSSFRTASPLTRLRVMAGRTAGQHHLR